MKIILTESQDAIKLASYLREWEMKKKVKVYTKIAHETYTTSYRARQKNTNEGLQPGFPDYVIVTETEVIFLELKKAVGGVLSLEQRTWLAELAEKKTAVTHCNGYLEAKLYLDKKLNVTIT